MIIQVETSSKIACAFFTLFGMVGFLFFGFFMGMFLQDNIPLINFPNLHLNNKFDFCQFCSIQQESMNCVILKIYFNLLMMSMFWIQHILMAKLGVKQFIIKYLPEFIFIERAWYNISSEFFFITFIGLWNPLHLGYIYKFDEQYRNAFMIINTLGFLLSLKAFIDMWELGDIIGWNFMKKVFRSKEISVEERYFPKDNNKIIVTKLYSVCRHPQQLGAIIGFLFSGLTISYDRILFVGYMITMIFYGVNEEEKRLRKLFESYKTYEIEVPNRFIPNILNLCKNKKTKVK